MGRLRRVVRPRNIFKPISVELVAAVMIVLVGCGVEANEPAFHQHDSLGIRITESLVPVWDSTSAWRLSEQPVQEIGVEEGPEEYQFYRIGAAHRFPDRSIVMSDGGSGELRFYDSVGQFVRRAGGHGSGPGEFGEYSSMQIWPRHDGRLAVWDSGNNRGNVFEADGRYLTTIHLESTRDLPGARARGVFLDGSWLADAPIGGGTLGGEPGDVIMMESAYSRYAPDGSFQTTLLSVSLRPRYVNRTERGGTHYPFIPFSHESQVVVYENHIFVWIGPDPVIQVRDTSGALVSLIRWHPSRDRSVSAVWDRYKVEALEQIPDERYRSRYRRLFAQDLPLPDEFPVALKLLVDLNGNVWLEQFRLPWDRSRKWDVIDQTGRWLGEVESPMEFTFLEIGTDYIIGRHFDELNDVVFA